MLKIVFCCAEDESLGIGYLSSHLKNNGHEVYLVFDPKQFSRPYVRNRRLAAKFDRTERNLARIEELRPDIIGFSCVTANYQWALNFARAIKSRFDIPIIFGGVHPTLVPDEVIKEDSVDIVCVGEGEGPVLELMDSMSQGAIRTDIENLWFKAGDIIIKNDIRSLNQDLDGLAYPDKRMFYRQLPKHYSENSSFLTGRGCPFTCTFCGNEQLKKIYKGKGKYVRQRSVDSCIDELRMMKEQNGTRYILFGDDILTTNLEWLKDFTHKYKDKVGLPYTCFGHARYMDDDRARLLKESGCRMVWLGVQSGCESLRREVLNRPESNEEIIKAAKAGKQAGLKLMVDHILELPGDCDEAIIESAMLYAEIKPDMLNVYNLLYFPTSKIAEIALEKGILSPVDIDSINKGEGILYQTGDLKVKDKNKKTDYEKYALFLTLIPLMPKRMTRWLGSSATGRRFIASLPLATIPIVKLLLNFRIGHGFIPAAVVKTELFYLKEWYTPGPISSKTSEKPTVTVLNNGLVVKEGMSGSDRRAIEWAKAMKGAGIHVRAVIPEIGRSRYEAADIKSHMTGDTNHKKHGYFLTYLFNAYRARRLKLKWKAGDVVYSSSDLIADALPAIYWKRKYPKIRWIAGMHLLAPPLFGAIGEGGAKELCRRVYHHAVQNYVFGYMRKYAELVMVSNSKDRETLIKRGFRSEQVKVLYGAVDVMDAAESEQNKATGNYTACFVGRLHPQKGVDDLFEIWKDMEQNIKDPRLAIIGEPDLEEYYLKEPKWRSKNIDFLGFLDGSQKYEVIKSSSVLLFPSSHESFGMVACEAMACGTPVVAYDLDVYREIYDGGMITVPRGDKHMFAAEAIEIIRDDRRRQFLSEQALATASKYRWENTAQILVAFVGAEAKIDG